MKQREFIVLFWRSVGLLGQFQLLHTKLQRLAHPVL